MLNKLVVLSIVAVNSILISGCTFGPFSSSPSAHTIEHKAISVQGGITVYDAVPYGRLSYGATENLELGLLSEFYDGFLTGVVAKYGFINNKEQGMSFSVESSLGKSPRLSYAYVSPIIGYKKNKWDNYLGLRYSYVHKNDKDESVFFIFDNKKTRHYGSAHLGSTYSITKNLGLNMNVNYIFGASGDDVFDVPYVGIGLIYVFR